MTRRRSRLKKEVYPYALNFEALWRTNQAEDALIALSSRRMSLSTRAVAGHCKKMEKVEPPKIRVIAGQV